MVSQTIGAFTDLLYPAECLACTEHLPNRDTVHLCEACLSEISKFEGEVCRKCGHPWGPFAAVERRCPNCRNRRLHFERAVSVGRYKSSLKNLVCGLKFGREPVYAVPLGLLMADTLRRYDLERSADMLIPVPLHPRKQIERGFNQSELLAAQVGRRVGLPVCVENLRRIRPTPSQTHFSRRQREKNVRGAFVVRRPQEILDRSVLLVDDVMTSGATTSECARVLYGAGAQRVIVITAAR